MVASIIERVVFWPGKGLMEAILALCCPIEWTLVPACIWISKAWIVVVQWLICGCEWLESSIRMFSWRILRA